MGIRYTNRALVADGKLDITKPEVLVYEPMPSGKLRLGAIEYFQADADQDLATDPDRPQTVQHAVRRPDTRPRDRDADPL
jgi:hypothetical protein